MSDYITFTGCEHPHLHTDCAPYGYLFFPLKQGLESEITARTLLQTGTINHAQQTLQNPSGSINISGISTPIAHGATSTPTTNRIAAYDSARLLYSDKGSCSSASNQVVTMELFYYAREALISLVLGVFRNNYTDSSNTYLGNSSPAANKVA